MNGHVERFGKKRTNCRADDGDVGPGNQRGANFNSARKIRVLHEQVEQDRGARVDDDVEFALSVRSLEIDVADFDGDALSRGGVVLDGKAVTNRSITGGREGDLSPNNDGVVFRKQAEFVPDDEISFCSVVGDANC